MSLASTKSKPRNCLQQERFQAQQRDKKLEEEINCCEKEYEAITIKLQKEIETKRAALATTREFLANDRMTVKEQINKDLDPQSIDSEERANRVVNYINAIDMEDFIQGRENLKTIRNNQRINKKNLKIKKNLNNVKKISQAIDTKQEETN